MKQTAVELLGKELESYGDPQFCKIEWEQLDLLIQQAKEMENEQIIDAYDIGSNEGYDLAKIDDIEEGHYMKEPIEYYNETFKSE